MADSTPRVVKTPRLGLGVTTLAMVALASGGTGVLVSHGTQQLQPPAPRASEPQALSPQPGPVVLDRAPGSVLLPRERRLAVPGIPVIPVARHSGAAQFSPPAPGTTTPVAQPPAAEPPAPTPVYGRPRAVVDPVLDTPRSPTTGRATKAKRVMNPRSEGKAQHGKGKGRGKHER